MVKICICALFWGAAISRDMDRARFFLPGSMISEEVTTSVTKSANYVVFLSYAFCASHESEDSKMKMEWRQIWNSYKEGNNKKVLLVNFDHVRCSKCDDRVIRAFLHLHFSFRFEKPILLDIQEEIGPPLCVGRVNENKKPVYRHNDFHKEPILQSIYTRYNPYWRNLLSMLAEYMWKTYLIARFIIYKVYMHKRCILCLLHCTCSLDCLLNILNRELFSHRVIFALSHLQTISQHLKFAKNCYVSFKNHTF